MDIIKTLNNFGLYTKEQYYELLDSCEKINEELEGISLIYNKTLESYDTLQAKYKQSEQSFSKASKTIQELESELYELKKQLKIKGKHSSLKTFKEWLDNNIEPVVKYHSDRSGRFRPSRKLRYSEQDEQLAWDFLDNMLKFKHSYYGTTTPDELVYAFNRDFVNKYPSKEYYIYDRDNYGSNEVWASFSVMYNNLKKGKLDDCDGFMVFKYVCIDIMLKKYFIEHRWRLRGFLTRLRGSGYHALLAWVKGEDMNDWVHIESTYGDQYFVSDWKRDMPLNKQALYDIDYSFDQDNEYIKLE